MFLSFDLHFHLCMESNFRFHFRYQLMNWSRRLKAP
ncbi:unnamed protein product [Amaranthus hypochondriacus]